MKKNNLYGFWLFFIKCGNSRHAHLTTYAVFGEESDVQVKNTEIRLLEAKK